MRMPLLVMSIAALAVGPALAQAEDAQPFRVFFDWAKPALTRDAEATLGELVEAYHQAMPARIDVAGHTDRSGSAAHNLGASRRRAEAVKAYLVAKGIPVSVIAVSAWGESRPIVPTEDGVREAQNRRVEISFHGLPPKDAKSAPLVGTDGSVAGSVSLIGSTLAIDAAGLPPGEHGMHLHAVGRCDLPDFASAGPHWNPANREHGSQNPQGPHLGDLPNLMVGADGRGRATLNLPAGYLDADGAALVIHASPDDNKTDPSGNSGPRIACAAFLP